MNKKTVILLLFILTKFLLQYWLIDPVYELHRDEYLHLDQGKHLAWGYLSVPPVTSWISYIILQLGNSVFWIKFFPALFGVLTLLVVWKAIEELKGGLFALVLGSTSVLLSVILRLNTLYQPNSLDVLLWTTLYYCLLKYIPTQNNKWLWWAAVTFALGFLNKYNIAFLLIGLIPALLLTQQRKLFTKPALYLAAALALLLVAPNLWWQYQNNFPVVTHMQELSERQLVNVNRSDFLKEQVLFFLPCFFVIVAALISFFVYDPFKPYRVFFWSFLLTLFVFIYFKAKGYYAIGLYPILLAFGSVYLESVTSHKWRVYLRPAALAVIVLAFLPMLQVGFPNKPPQAILENPEPYQALGLLRWEDGKEHTLPQDFADMVGWKELAQKTDSVYGALRSKGHTIVLCDNYGQAGAINYYSRYKDMQAVSMNADYIEWFPLHKEVVNVVLIQEITDTDKGREKEKPLFKKVSWTGQITIPYAREYGTSIYALEGARVSINDILQKEIDAIKKRH
ncbi:MAG TPA: glycosyltransferase family 39 protein [Flavisolibacter sp.]|nr:glycosyltransferase family 39 protein [Flavisolibacter sp.]